MLINLTPHEIVIRSAGDSEVRIPPSGLVARVESRAEPVGQIEGIPIVRTTWGSLQGLPEPRPGVWYIASMAVAQAAAAMGREDVLAPDTGPESAVRDAAGRIIAVRRLQRF